MDVILNRIFTLYKNRTESTQHKKNELKLYLLVYEVIKTAILQKDLPDSVVLPATRELAQALKVSRSTVIKSYEILRLEGYIEAKLGSGHLIKHTVDDPNKKKLENLKEIEYPELSELGQSFLKNISLINSTDDKSVAFRPGLPPLDIFPVSQWKNLSNLYWRKINISGLSYSSSSGNEQLKKNLSQYLLLSRNLKCDPGQIFIVSGSLQSLFLLGSIILNPGDSVNIENPTFPNVHSIFKGLRCNIQGIPIDKEGISLEEIKQQKNLAKITHITPSCHYPTGNIMSLKRRMDLLKWVSQNKSWIIENDYEHELSNSSNSLPPLFNLDKEQRTIYLSTFNRLLHPSLRIGYMVVPNVLVPALEAFLKHSHRFVAPSIQIVLNQFIEKKYLYNHLKNLVEVTQERKASFISHFDASFKQKIRLQNSQAESLQVLGLLPDGISDTALVEYFAKHHIVSHAYSKCFTGEEKQQGLIMGYSSVRTPILKIKLAQMERLFNVFKS